jgi:hypothetical protein
VGRSWNDLVAGARWDGNGGLDDAVQRIRRGEIDPYSAAQSILKSIELAQ